MSVLAAYCVCFSNVEVSWVIILARASLSYIISKSSLLRQISSVISCLTIFSASMICIDLNASGYSFYIFLDIRYSPAVSVSIYATLSSKLVNKGQLPSSLSSSSGVSMSPQYHSSGISAGSMLSQSMLGFIIPIRVSYLQSFFASALASVSFSHASRLSIIFLIYISSQVSKF